MHLREDALKIWNAAVAAADSIRAVQSAVSVRNDVLSIAGREFRLTEQCRLLVVGAGKAGAGMAAGVEQALRDTCWFDRLQGWVNIPDDCVRPLERIHLHPSRPAGLNEPTDRAVSGTQEIIRRLESCGPHDVCLVLISGGGSALLCSPVAGISLEEKLLITRALSRAGATIDELNLVRTHLSLVKGGGLARACRAGFLSALVIADVLGDPPQTIASGPVTAREPDPERALQVLHRYLPPEQIPAAVEAAICDYAAAAELLQLDYTIVAANQLSLVAASRMAESLGYRTLVREEPLRGSAAVAGREFLQQLREHRKADNHPCCLLAGGETTVNLSDAGGSAGKGGRNQEFVLAAADSARDADFWHEQLLLSGGTDGEDGPTDAAGAFFDSGVLQQAEQESLDSKSFLQRHDAWNYFAPAGGLLQTGPTHTNVMDIAVGLCGQTAESGEY